MVKSTESNIYNLPSDIMDEKGIKVLMVGGRRSGKSSMLAGLFEAMLSEDVRGIVKVEDVTEGQLDSPLLKIKELKEQLKECAGKIIMDDKLATDKFNPYKLKISLPLTEHSTQIIFTDVNGEYYTNLIGKDGPEAYQERRERLLREVNHSDVILIAIDTPYLMEGVGAQNSLVNCMDGVQDLLADLKMEEQAKLVVLVPMRCEKWVRRGRIDDVVSKVEREYEDIIRSLASPFVEILVIPVSTVGSMEFHEFRHPYSYMENGQTLCCSITDDDNHVRFSDGRTVLLTRAVEARLTEDSRSVFPGTHIIRPNEWFLVTGSDYKPKNCEQLAYHILRYTLERTQDAIDAENIRRRRFNVGRGLVNLLLRLLVSIYIDYLPKLGEISTAELNALIMQLSDGGFIKNTGDGIKVLQKYKRTNQ